MLRQPRTWDYHLLRVCERLGLREREFEQLEWSEQCRLLAYERIRGMEEGLGTAG